MSWKDESVEKWHKANPERVRQHKRRYSAKNPRTPQERKRLWDNYVAVNRERYLASKRERKRNNRSQNNQWESKRRAIKRGASAVDCAVKFAELSLERFCRWCCGTLTEENRTVDHIVPLSRGGEHKPENLCASCYPCNYSKGKKLVHEWLPFQKFNTAN
jgi:5-methylcytosine-specific restriction endonuclease McrA